MRCGIKTLKPLLLEILSVSCDAHSLIASFVKRMVVSRKCAPLVKVMVASRSAPRQEELGSEM